MNIDDLVANLEEIKDVSSRNEKLSILEDIVESDNKDAFIHIAKFLFNTHRKLGVKVTPDMVEEAFSLHDPEIDDISDEDIFEEFKTLLAKLENSELSGNAARDSIVKFLSLVYDAPRDMFASIFNKSWKIGVGLPTMRKLLGSDFIKTFDVQLCGKLSKYRKKYGDDFPHDYFCQRKIDGVRAVVGDFPEDSDELAAVSRVGKSLGNWHHLKEDLLKLTRNGEYVVDGEFYVDNFETTMEVVSRSTRDHELSPRLEYHVFDIIQAPFWHARACPFLLEERDAILKSRVDALGKSNIIYVPHELVRTKAQVEDALAKNIAEGWEGIILKDPRTRYGYDRSLAWIKEKVMEEVDATITGIEVGIYDENTSEMISSDDTRYANAVGQVVVTSIQVDPGNGVITKVGSGFKVAQRLKMYRDYIEDPNRVLGKLVEIHYQEITPDKKLRFPIFKKFVVGI